MDTLKKLLLLVAIFAVLAVVVTVVQVAALNFYNPHNTAWMRIRVRQAAAEHKELKILQTWRPLSVIPRNLQMAVIAAEDEKFYQHHGFDWESMKQAREQNERRNRIKRGASTITQQLAKNLYLSPERSYIRKAREAFITVVMELLLSKERILELYLNCIEFGPGTFGVDEGARFHFGIALKKLSLDQSCRLAAIIPAPRRRRR
jgi:monofunctional biosynthetic peptidoglycan transglycosylase